ncbi:MAG TPA: LCP family protein [Candidatus Saccharimonadales bacterium]|nr:LCP family protein [Candidatus Saccharimonadales bacterium]
MNDEIIISQDELGSSPKPPKRRWRNWPHWRRALKWLGFTVLLVIIAVAAFLYINVAKISVNPFGFGDLKGESSGRVNILMLGVGDPGHAGEELSDTDIVLSIDTQTHQIAVISVPRDTQVDIPGYGDGKINNANADGGVPLAETVFQNTLGIPIDYYVKANFTGLKEVVDAVGGVDVDNTTYLSDPSYPCDNNQYASCGYTLPPGHYHLNGEETLKYVRCREGTCGNDFGRAARQQEVMEQIRERATSAGTLSNPVTLGKLVSAAGNNIQTNLSLSNLMRLEQLTKGVGSSNIFNIVFNITSDGFLVQSPTNSNLLPADGTFAAIQNFVQNVFKYGPIWTEHPTVAIENGTTTTGIGGKFKQQLADDGYDINVASVSDALASTYATSEIIDYTGGKRPHTVAYLEGLLNVKKVTAPPTSLVDPPANIVVILGADYAAKVSPTSTSSSTSNSATQ